MGRKKVVKSDPVCNTCNVLLTDGNWTPSNQKYRKKVCQPCWAARQKVYADKDPLHREKQQVRRLARESIWSDERRLREHHRRKNSYL